MWILSFLYASFKPFMLSKPKKDSFLESTMGSDGSPQVFGTEGRS